MFPKRSAKMIEGTEKPKIPSKFVKRVARYNEFGYKILNWRLYWSRSKDPADPPDQKKRSIASYHDLTLSQNNKDEK